MNVPLDRLYHYIENISQEIYGDRIVIYRFWPHGSKNIKDLNSLDNLTSHQQPMKNWIIKMTSPLIWCNDQEPLDYEFYKKHTRINHDDFANILNSIGFGTTSRNLNYLQNIFKKSLLLHSEQRSHNLEKYQLDNELIPVYYWSHAVIARDWFRYAKHETFQKNTKKTFLIYNRAWSGTREYRLGFSDLLITCGLIDQCQTTCNPIDSELNLHYSTHIFNNSQWRPTHVLENYLQPTTADSTSSADFNTDDYNLTDIEVVLETLFDDNRLHLTEKTLRPIACGQPFILVGTHGSLEYLHNYGFKTFDTIWNENYDKIQSSEERLPEIVSIMQQIARWDPETRADKMAQARSIADYNRQWFFSKEFFDLVLDELKTNLKLAFEELGQCDNYKSWIDLMLLLMQYPEINNFLKTNQDPRLPSKESVEYVIKLAQSRLT